MQLSAQDISTIIGLVFGIICGVTLGRYDIYRRLNKTNLLQDNIYDDPSNQMSMAERFNIGAVGGLFFIIGLCCVVIPIVMSFASMDFEEQNVIIVFGFLAMGMGGLVLYPAITGKRVS